MIVYLKKIGISLQKVNIKNLRYIYNLFPKVNVMIFNIIFLILIDNYYNR